MVSSLESSPSAEGGLWQAGTLENPARLQCQAYGRPECSRTPTQGRKGQLHPGPTHWAQTGKDVPSAQISRHRGQCLGGRVTDQRCDVGRIILEGDLHGLAPAEDSIHRHR
jgi:hypothetical protein